jgi:hypothetical protein
MTDVNHRRDNRKPVNQRYGPEHYHNGYAPHEGIRGQSQRVGNTDYLDKSLHSWGRVSEFADIQVAASIPNDFTNGHRGMAKAVRGAKKFVRTRIRFHENAATKKLAREADV